MFARINHVAICSDHYAQRFAREVRRVLSLEAMRRFLDDRGIEAGDLGPEALKAYIASEHARYGRMVRETGVHVE